MKNAIFILFIIGVLSVSCNNDKKDELPQITPIQPYELLLKEYGLLNEKDVLNSAIYSKESEIFFYGLKYEKIVIKGFDTYTKRNILNWESKYQLESEITINKAYGIVEKYLLSVQDKKYFISSIVNYSDGFAFMTTYYYPYLGGRKLIYNLHFITKSNEIIKKIISENVSDNYILLSFNKWYNNNSYFIGKYGSDKDIYSLNGDSLYQIPSINFKYDAYTVLSTEEILCYTGGQPGKFKRLNMKEGITVWESLQPLKDKPDNIKIDLTKIEKIDVSFTKCTFNYTTYEGGKYQISFKINNSNGEFQEIQ